jgi:hypothetical protein
VRGHHEHRRGTPAPQREVADREADHGGEDGEGPAEDQLRRQHHPEHEGGEALAWERDAEPPGERSGANEQGELQEEGASAPSRTARHHGKRHGDCGDGADDHRGAEDDGATGPVGRKIWYR